MQVEQLPELPVEAVVPELRTALMAGHEAILQAPPGAGKTTRIPLALLHEPWLRGDRILLLEPRRLAAKAVAERMAETLGEKVGETVGYRIRLETRVGPKTRIEVVTEGILTRMLQTDPALEGVGLLIFDEFHERSLDADLALALALHARRLLREEVPLKLLIMSATLETERLSGLLGNAAVVCSEGRLFPVDIRWQGSVRYPESLEAVLLRTIVDAIEHETGSLLVFLPGQAEIRRLAERLENTLDAQAVMICPLHGQLALTQQRQAILPAPAGRRKIVLATNIAETSLTIEGIRIVIDSGLLRAPRFDPATGMTRLATQRISRASATQRAGRAGRLSAGICYRLWSEEEHERLVSQAVPEILQADLCGLALQLACWGARPDELLWLDEPPSAAFAQAGDLLVRLGALSGTGKCRRLTDHGRAMGDLPVHPRLAHLLLKAHALGLTALGCDLAAVLSERDVLQGQGADLQDRLTLLHAGGAVAAGQRPLLQRIRQLSARFRQLLPAAAAAVCRDDPQHSRWLGCLLAFAYPDRIARQRRDGSGDYRLANGRAARFGEPEALMKAPWLVVANLGGHVGRREERIHLAAALEPALFDTVLKELTRQTEVFDWDESQGRWCAERQLKVGELVLATTALPPPSGDVRRRALLDVVRRKGPALLPWTPELRQWQARVGLLRALDGRPDDANEWPDVGDAALFENLESWLGPYLNEISRLSQFAELDLAAILQGLLPWPLPKKLEEQAPRTYEVPSGSRLRIDYGETPPVLAVRLQEMFGLSETPRIAQGRLPLKLHLLSPAGRPVQVTQDLASFWRTAYGEVKRDLKGRYPKHFWPDDPLRAEPTARSKPRRRN